MLERPLVAVRGDRFIVRAENARATLGGGEVVAPAAERHRRGDAATVTRLETIRTGAVADAVAATIELSPALALPAAEIAERLDCDEESLRAGVGARAADAREIRGGGAARASAGAADAAAQIVVVGEPATGELWMTSAGWDAIRGRIGAIVARHHAHKPLEPGIEMEAVRAELPPAVTAKVFRVIVERLAGERVVVRRESLLAAPSHRVDLGADESLAREIESELAHAGYTPPELRELEARHRVSRRRMLDVLGVLEKSGRVVRVGEELYYATAVVARVRAALEDALAAQETITAAELRDRLAISRKFSIALLDYFDRSGVTLRVGDARKLRRPDRAS